MPIKKITIILMSLASPLVHGMVLQEKQSLYQDAPLTQWPKAVTTMAYAGARYDTDIVAAKAKALSEKKEEWDEETCTIMGWSKAIEETQKELLTKPFETWTDMDIRYLSAWITFFHKNVKHPGTFRYIGEPTYWQIREMSAEEWKHIKSLVNRKILLSVDAKLLARVKSSHPDEPHLYTPLTKEEELLVQRSVHLFPLSEDIIETELTTAMMNIQEQLRRIRELPWKQRQQQALSLGCKFHYDIVRIHPFIEGAKRLGRLCKYIIHAQHGIRPLKIADPAANTRVLIESLLQKSHLPFETYFRRCLEAGEAKLKAIEPAGKDQPVTPGGLKNISLAQTIACGKCGKKGEGFQRCAACKEVYYCSKECQKDDWITRHKKQCITKPSPQTKN